jgi:hypothetical protein
MIISNTASIRSTVGRTALIALGCAFVFALVQVPALKAADTAAAKSIADKAPCLPRTATFETVPGDSGPHVLNLKNDSKDGIKISVKILLSVAFHGDTKAKNLPEHVIDAGQVWTIPGLAAGDKIIVTAKGFAPLELTVQ